MQIQSILSRKKYTRALAAGCVALAAGGIVLLRTPHGTSAATAGELRITSAGGAPRAEFSGPSMHGRTALSQGAVLANGTRQVYAELRLGADARRTTGESGPIAMAVVLDISGSMGGEKIDQARRSVLELVNRMREFDQIALVTYSDTVHVVQALAPVREVRDRLRIVIPTIEIEGGTNIPLGLESGAMTLASAPSGMVRRVVLVSDGQDTSGRPLEQISAEVRRRSEGGVTLSSLGIGSDYDERFMSNIADSGRGNYAFLRDGSQLAPFLARELQQATSTTIERLVAEVSLPNGWRLSHSYGANVEGTSGSLRIPIGSLFAGDERRVVLDLAVDGGASGTSNSLGVNVTYRAVPEARDVNVSGGLLAVRAVSTEAEALATREMSVFAEAEAMNIAGRQAQALQAWREGRAAEATAMAQQNVAALSALNAAAPSAAIAAQVNVYRQDQGTFGSVGAGSAPGRAYGLRSNAWNHGRMQRAASVEAF